MEKLQEIIDQQVKFAIDKEIDKVVDAISNRHNIKKTMLWETIRGCESPIVIETCTSILRDGSRCKNKANHGCFCLRHRVK